MRLNEYEIVIEPNEIIFDQIQPNAVFTRTLNIKNVGNKGKRMELFRPSNKVFRLIFKQPELPVPPGMEIAAVVEFETPIGQEYNDKMVISIDNREIEIPIHAYPAKPVLVFDDVIDFGTLSAINKTVSKQLKITNQGALDGEFLIEYNGKLPISFSPSREIVPAYSTLTLTVDIFTKTPGKYEENIKVNFQSGHSKNLKLRANLMKRELILQDSKNSQPIKKLEFGSCYYGCNLLSLVMLYNASPDRVDYVIILEENGVGTELGTDLSKSTNALRSEKNEYDEKDFAPIGKLVSAFPNNGTLQPFERRPIFLRFSPQYKNPDSGFSTILKPPPRRDYAIFLYFELLGDSSNNRTELAITGTALPVILRVIPNRMDFGNCTIGEKREMQAVLYNDSELKDVRFKFRKVANYTVLPASGRIKARSNKNVTVSFVPHQMGACNYDLICEVIDKMAELDNPLVSLDKMICQYSIHLSGYSLLLSNIPEPKYSGGIMPLITNEVGINVNTSVSNLKSFLPKAAVQNAPNDSLHSTSYSKKFKSAEEADAYKVAFPNDRAKSIGPFDRKEKYKTLFTGVDRYNYIDPDYAYTNEEIEAIENHKRIYKKYLNDLHFYRQETWKTKEFKAFNDVINAGLKPSGGLKPQMPSLTDLHEEAAKPPKFNVDPNWKLMTTEELQSQQKAIKNLKSNNNNSTFNSLPITEKNKLSTILAPAQIYKIIVSPSIVDFGEVCVNSVSAKNMEFYNTLDQPIHVELEINCSELSQTNTTSQIISPQSKGTFQILFESEYVQSFQRSISYRINFSYRHHIIIQADCKLPSLKLSTNHLVLNQIGDVQPEFCYRSNITILNPFNSTAEFSWIPIFGEQGTAFSIRPASGTIEPYRDLECEVVWHGSFLAPLKGTFTLQVAGGESATLTCEAKLGQAQLHFINRRASFGKIPINMTSIKTFYMTNVGSHNAYFQVLDPRPMQGMVIKPSFGLAPVNGLTPIRVEISPKEVLKFDARVMLQIRGGKQLELRLSGESEDPAIDIDLPLFDFGGVYSGATSALPFKIINKSLVKSKIEFNLKRYPDFFIKTKEKSLNALSVNDQIYEVEIQSNQTLEMELNFSPNEVASYDFDLPIFINRTLLNSQSDQAIDQYNLSQLNSALSPYYEKMTESEQLMREKTPMTRKSGSRVTTAQHQFLKRRVTAVGLRHALHLSSSTINFRIPIRYFENLKEGGFYEAKSTMLINQSHRPVKWCFDLRRSNKVLEDGIFKVCDGSMVPFISTDKKSYGPEGEIQPKESYELKILFCPDKPGTYKCNLPIVINNNFEHPYYNIEVVGELLSPEIHFDPDVLIFKPVPLGVEISDQILIKQRGYESKSKLRLEIPESKTIDGDMVKVIEAKFVNEPIINPSDETPIELAVKFCSLKPISNQAKLRFVDDQNREYFFTVIFTADNSLFTCYSFMAEHNNDYRVVLEPDNAMKSSRVNHSAVEHIEQGGEPILRPFTGGSRHSVGINNNSVSPTFNLDHFSSPMNQQALSVDGAMLGGTSSGMGSRFMTATNIGGSKAYEQLLFPSSDTISGVYALEILKVLQRWFRCHGWPTALHLVTIPNSFRGGVSRKPLDEGLENMPQQDAAKQENKTIYEMISHLCGRPLPAIPVGSPVPVDLAERTTLFAWQHNVLLKFLETQGGCVSQIRPEHLLDVNEFECWTDLMNRKKRDAEELSGYKKNEVEQRDTPFFSTKLFNLVSKKAWLESLLQLLKICVLNRITPKLFSSMSVPFQKDASFPEVKSDPLTSNIYSMGERILLTWLNFCYSNYKSKIWPHNEPPNKWIVNFDVDLTDSLVLAACIGAYCPFVIDGLISRMYMVADTAEKCFHNALLLVEACRRIGIDYDITSLDITDPNSIYMLLFCSYLFKKLPGYVPSANVEFKSQLHLATTRQIKISNPSAKSIFYQAILCGKGVDEFSLPHGNELLIQPKGKFNLAVEYKGNNLLPKTCYLLLVGRKRNSLCPDTLVFALNSKIDELATKKLFKLETPLYKPVEMTIDIENPYDKAAEFKVKIIESGSRNGTVRNPFIENESPVFKIKSKTTLDTINFKSFTQSISNNSKCIDSDEKKEELDPNVPIYKSFFTKTESIYLEPKVKKQIVISYLPLQYIKHAGLILLSNEKVGEFIYHLEGNALLPEPSKTVIEEKSLDADRVKIIRPNNSEVKSLMLRCYAGDKIKIKLLIPVCNNNREKAIATATEMRMSEFELNRRNVHGILSSKSLLESLNSLTLNKPLPKNESSRATKSSLLTKLSDMSNESSLKFKVVCNSKNSLILPENLLINSSDIKFDDNFVPLVIQFNADRVGTSNARIELKSLPNDVRIFEIDFKVIENGVIDSNTVARLQFHSCVFDPIAQPIPIKNSSDVICNYAVDLINRDEDGAVFKGPTKFSIKPKDIFIYELTFLPNAENKFEGEIVFNNLTEGSKIKYTLIGIGERRAPLGEIKLETRVGQISQHEIMIPNKTSKKICYYVSSTDPFIKGPEKLMILPNRKESYSFEIHPIRRGDFKGVLTFKPGEWPIKDVDSDGEEMGLDSEERPQHFTLWYTFDIKIRPSPPLSSIELDGYAFETTTLWIPLSNPLNKKLKFEVIKSGLYLEGDDFISIDPQEKINYELRFSPKQAGKFRGSLIFVNDDCGEFWYDLKLTSEDPQVIQTDIIEAEVGRYATQTLKLSNPLNEPVQFQTLISNPSNFALDRKQNECIQVEPNGKVDVNIIFTPSTLGLAPDHTCLVTFYNEKIGNICYELRGVGLQPEVQDPINITAEIGHSQMIVVNFRNSTNEPIYCDILLLDEEKNNVIESVENSFNILLNGLENVLVEAKSILDIPIVFTPTEMKRFNVNLIVTATRGEKLSWEENDSEAFAVINAISKAMPFVIECTVRKRLEKRMEVILDNTTTYASGHDRSFMKLRAATPAGIDESSSLKKLDSPNSLVVLGGEVANLASEFVHSIQFTNASCETVDLIKNSISIKLIRVQRDKSTGLVTLLFDIVFSPFRSFITDAYLQVETALGGMWRFPLKLVSVEPPPDDVIIIEAYRLNSESVVGFRLTSKSDKSIPFRAKFVQDQSVFSVTPSQGELLSEEENGTLIKVGFTPNSYGKTFQSYLIINTPNHQWKYLVKGIPPEYSAPRGQSAIRETLPYISKSGQRENKKRNFIIENTYIIQTAVSSPIKGASLK